MYRQVPKHQKIIVARSIVHAVSRQDPPGRFLERRGGAKKGGGGGKKGGGGDNLWYEVPFERAVEKAKQALRERGKDEDDTDDEEGGGATRSVGNGPAAAATGAGTAFARPALPPPLVPNRPTVGIASTQLSVADEAVATRYRNMLQFGVAPSVVRSKMDNERIAPHIVQSVLSCGGGTQPQQAQPQRHVQFASGTNTPTHGSFSIVPAKRRVSSVLLSMLVFGDDDTDDKNGTGGARPTGLPQEVLDVIEEITPEGEDHTGPAAAAASGAAATSPSQGGGGGNGGPAAASQRRRSSIFNLFRRKSRSVGGGALTFEQRSCTSIKYDSESHRKLLVELKADGVDVEGDGDGDIGDGGGGQGATAVGTAATSAATATLADKRSILAEKGQQRKRKASSMAMTSPGKSRASLSIVRQQQQIAQQQPQQQKTRPTSIAEAAALVAAETELEEMEPEDVHAQPKRISFSPALFGNLFGSFSAGNVDGAGNPVEAPGTTTMAQAAAASSAGGHPADASSPGLLRQSTSAARRSLVATMNLFQQATGKEDPLADTNRSEGSYADGDGASEPSAKRRRRSTWLSGLRFSTMPAAVESATSAVAAAQAVQGMGLVKDEDDDDYDSIAQKPAAVDDGL